MGKCKIASSKVFIEGIKIHAYHGVLPQERIVGNDYVISVSAEYDVSKAAESDDVADTLNYADIFNAVKDEMGKPSKLIEHVAGRIAERLFRQFEGIESLTLKVVKANPPMGADCDGAGIVLQLTNDKN